MPLRRRQFLAAGASTVGLAIAASLGACTAPVQNRTWLKARLLGTRDNLPGPGQPPASAEDSLEQEYESRWYRLGGLQPGDDVTVTLNMPADADVDYTLLGYTDIREVADRLIAKINASGSIDADDMDSDDMDSDDMDSDDMDSDDMDSDDMDSDDMDSDDMDSDDMDSGDLDSDDMDSGDRERYRDVYSRAQRHALRSASITSGPAPEQIHMIARAGSSGDLYCRVRGHHGAFAPGKPFRIEATVKPDTSCEGAPHEPRRSAIPLDVVSGKHNTLILTNSDRKSLALRGDGDRASFQAVLNKLASLVDGVVYDLRRDDRLGSLYTAWDLAKTCVPLANAIVESIRSIVADIVKQTGAGYLVIAGGDDVIPFARIEDRAEISREWAWAGPYDPTEPLGAALTYGAYLSDDPYSRSGPLDMRGRSVRAPERATGRLVETWRDIEAYINWFVGPGGRNGIIIRSALVSGYGFVSDLADKINSALGDVQTDIDLNNDTWKAIDLAGKLMPAAGAPIPTYSYKGPYQLIAAQGHYSANTLLPPNEGSTKLRPTDPSVAKNSLGGVVWMTIGCHSAHDIVDQETRDNYEADKMQSWAETLLRQGATLVGGTGYQYGESDLPENSERLYNYLTQELASSTGRPIGDALVVAKRRYLQERLPVRGMDQKIVEVATVYGVPMLRVGVEKPKALPAAPPVPKDIDKPITGKGTEQRPVAIDGYRLSPVRKNTGTYFTTGEPEIVRPLRPVLPGVFRNITRPGVYPVGVLWTGGSFTDADHQPLISQPVTEQPLPAARRPKYQSRAFLPARPFRIARSRGAHTLVFAPMQFNAQGATGRQWSEAAFTICYASASDRSALRDAPKIQKPRVFVDGGELKVSLSIRHYASADEPVEAYASYLDQVAHKLVTVKLSGGSSSAVGATWRRDFTGSLRPAPLDSLVCFQAVGGNGRVSALTNGGRLFGVVGGGRRRTAMTLSVASAAGYRDRITASAKLFYVDNRAAVTGDVLFRLGGSRIWKRTTGGMAEVQLTVATPPRDATYLVVASFPGEGDAGPSAASSVLAVIKAKSQLALRPPDKMPDTQRTQIGTLNGTSRSRPLGDRPILVEREKVLYVLYTDPDGTLWIEPSDVGMTTGTADLKIWFDGDPRYEGTAPQSLKATFS